MTAASGLTGEPLSVHPVPHALRHKIASVEAFVTTGVNRSMKLFLAVRGMAGAW